MTFPASQLVFFRHPNYTPASHDPNDESFEKCLSELNEIAETYPIPAKKSLYEKIQGQDVDKRQWGVRERLDFDDEYNAFFKVMERQFHLAGKKILEVGSGMLLNGRSYLSRAFPDSKFTLSDQEAVVALNKEWQEDYIQLNLLKSVQKANRLFKFVMASNVFDTLPYDALPKAFQRISTHLEDGGVFFHFATMEFFRDAFFDICSREKPDCTLLPSNYSTQSVYRINKERVKIILNDKRQQLSPTEFKFFSEWNEKDPQIQACTIANIYRKSLINDFSLFESRCQEIFSKNLESIKSEDRFEHYMKKAAEENGFKVESCDYYQSETSLPSKENIKIVSKMGVRYYEKLPSNLFQKNTLTQAVQLHMFMARKVTATTRLKGN